MPLPLAPIFQAALEKVAKGLVDSERLLFNPKAPAIKYLESRGYIAGKGNPGDEKLYYEPTELGWKECPAYSFHVITYEEPSSMSETKTKITRGPRVKPEITMGDVHRPLPDVLAKRSKEMYRFGDLAAPVMGPNGWEFDYFFVATTEEMPDPGKSIRPVVNAANKREIYRKAGREFVSYPTAVDEKTGIEGSLVFRTDGLHKTA